MYLIKINGDVVDRAPTWREIMQKYRKLRRTSAEPVILDKEEEDENNS